jgi:thioredoxin reductase (NADPH)
MPQLKPLSADIRGEAFPKLTEEQIGRIRPLSKLRQVRVGEILFEPGELDIPFFVLLSGSMDVVQPDRHGERLIVKHDAGGFTGEITMISGRRGLARGRVTKDGEFLEMSGAQLKALVARDAELSEILMRAFILRRVELINRGQGNAIRWARGTRRRPCACASFYRATDIPSPTSISTRTPVIRICSTSSR